MKSCVLQQDISQYSHTAEFTADDHALNERADASFFVHNGQRFSKTYIHWPASWIRLGSSLYNL